MKSLFSLRVLTARTITLLSFEKVIFFYQIAKNIEGAIQVLLGVCGHVACANDGAPLVGGGKDEGIGVDSLVKEFFPNYQCIEILANNNGNNGRVAQAT